jgi:CheY-like chemotaxis protein
MASYVGNEASIDHLRVLVVDDDPDQAISLVDILGLWGHKAEMALDGQSALEKALAFRPHVVLVDLKLPKLNGVDLAKKLRQEASSRNGVLIALTGFPDMGAACSEAGFDHYLIKPQSPAHIQEILNSVALQMASA